MPVEASALPEPPITVYAAWDAEASVFVAESDEVPGLATEGATVDLLIEKLQVMIPELLAANGRPTDKPLAFKVVCERQATTVQNAA